MSKRQDERLWALLRAERTALAEDLSTLDADQWRHDTLCGQWDVEQVVTHLTAAASVNQGSGCAACSARAFVLTCTTNAASTSTAAELPSKHSTGSEP